MSTSPLPPHDRKPVSLAKLATTFAVAFILAFGLCTVSAISGASRGSRNGIVGVLVVLALIIEGICAVGLLIIAIVAIARKVQHKQETE